MRNVPPGLLVHMQSGTTTVCNCWRVIRRDSTTLGFTDHDRAISFEGTVFEAVSGFTGSAMESELGLAVGGGEVSGAWSSGLLTESDLSNGLYDGARVEAFLVNWAEPTERVLLDVTVIGEVRRNDTGFTAELRSLAHVLDQERGRLYQSLCSADLGDVKCKFVLESEPFRVEFPLVAYTPDASLEIDTTDYETGWFAGGRLEFLTGANAGAIFAIESFTRKAENSVLRTWVPLQVAPAPGDLLRLFAGCDKRFETCRSKFSNAENFRGFPHMPGNDALLSHPGANDGPMDGGSLFVTESI